MALQKVVLTQESDGVPDEEIPVDGAGAQTEPSKRKASPWSPRARQSVVAGHSTAPSEEAWATAVGDDQGDAAAVVVVERPVVVDVGSEVVRAGPAAGVHAVTSKASTTTAIGRRVRSPGVGGR
jgi:hypothetical protein